MVVDGKIGNRGQIALQNVMDFVIDREKFGYIQTKMVALLSSRHVQQTTWAVIILGAMPSVTMEELLIPIHALV